MTPEKIRFSFIITNYNYENYLRACLDSVTSQTYDKSLYEIVCVDDGSQDGSWDLIQSYARRFSNFVATRIENSGLEKACNHGIRLAKNEWIVRVDSDDTVAPNLLQRIDEEMTAHPGHDFYYCRNFIEYYSEQEKTAKELPDFDKEEVLSRGDFFATGTAYRKSDLEDIGLFPEHVKNCGLENYTVIVELLSRGKRGFPVPGTFFNYRRHHSNMSTVKRDAIIRYGKDLLGRYGRTYQTNQYHPYNLILNDDTR